MAARTVGIADIEALREFQKTWMWHHPLLDEQLAYAGKDDWITIVSYYHGGTPFASSPAFQVFGMSHVSATGR